MNENYHDMCKTTTDLLHTFNRQKTIIKNVIDMVIELKFPNFASAINYLVNEIGLTEEEIKKYGYEYLFEEV